MGSSANLCQVIILIHLVMCQATFSRYLIKMLQIRVRQRFSNNILQELCALSNSSSSLLVHNSSRQTTPPNKCRDDKTDAGDEMEVSSSLQQD